ncbi:histidine phosphatase family protein [Plantactinospora solaniradicis]|uniref:Histidine phosphatase family protein n=1 Tax=Plantactinospora solaniradicis TaxID=1723736 RepID=A0ABW1KLY8_9ACTN
MIALVYFVHGTTVDNENGVATGWRHGELSAKGLSESCALSRVVSGSTFSAIYSSDLRRALKSATLVFGDRYDIFPDGRLRECDYGQMTGSPVRLIQSVMVDSISRPFPGGESYKSVEDRVARFLEDLIRKWRTGRIGMVGHQGPQLALEVLLQGKSWEQAIDEDWRRSGDWQPGWEYSLA